MKKGTILLCIEQFLQHKFRNKQHALFCFGYKMGTQSFVLVFQLNLPLLLVPLLLVVLSMQDTFHSSNLCLKSTPLHPLIQVWIHI